MNTWNEQTGAGAKSEGLEQTGAGAKSEGLEQTGAGTKSEGLDYTSKISTGSRAGKPCTDRVLYRITVKFQGRKLLRIAHFCHAKRCQVSKLHEKTFVNGHKTIKFTKVFSLKSFPLHGNPAGNLRDADN